MKTMFTAMFAAMLALLACQAVCGQICYAPQSESRFYLTLAMGDFYVANDFNRGQILIVFGSDPAGEHWSIVDLNTNITYINVPGEGCKGQLFSPQSNQMFEQCLPADAALVKDGDLIDFYYMTRMIGNENLKWLVGVTPIGDTGFYKRSVSRFFHEGVVTEELGVLVQFSLGISDPTLFDKDLSVCVDAPLGS